MQIFNTGDRCGACVILYKANIKEVFVMSMEKFANHVIAVAQENNTSITNLQLQKVMYFVLKKAKENEILTTEQLEEIYDEPFQVWAYGPVVRGQYNRFREFSSAPIIGEFEKTDEYNILNDYINNYINKNVFDLVDSSHEIPFWKDNADRIVGFTSNVSYSLGDI